MGIKTKWVNAACLRKQTNTGTGELALREEQEYFSPTWASLLLNNTTLFSAVPIERCVCVFPLAGGFTRELGVVWLLCRSCWGDGICVRTESWSQCSCWGWNGSQKSYCFWKLEKVILCGKSVCVLRWMCAVSWVLVQIKAVIQGWVWP